MRNRTSNCKCIKKIIGMNNNNYYVGNNIEEDEEEKVENSIEAFKRYISEPSIRN